MISSKAQFILIAGFTAVFTGYLTVWLPGPGAGLSFLGIEMGEWFKFVGLGSRRDIFYLPPIILALMLAIWTMTWPDNSWRAWSIRAIALSIAFLAFPAIEDITGPVREQYTLRVLMIILVATVCLISSFWRLDRKLVRLPWMLLIILAVIGLVLPTWMYFDARAYAAQIMGVSIGVGLGVWLNGIGNCLVMGVSLMPITTTRDR